MTTRIKTLNYFTPHIIIVERSDYMNSRHIYEAPDFEVVDFEITDVVMYSNGEEYSEEDNPGGQIWN